MGVSAYYEPKWTYFEKSMTEFDDLNVRYLKFGVIELKVGSRVKCSRRVPSLYLAAWQILKACFDTVGV